MLKAPHGEENLERVKLIGVLVSESVPVCTNKFYFAVFSNHIQTLTYGVKHPSVVLLVHEFGFCIIYICTSDNGDREGSA